MHWSNISQFHTRGMTKCICLFIATDGTSQFNLSQLIA